MKKRRVFLLLAIVPAAIAHAAEPARPTPNPVSTISPGLYIWTSGPMLLNTHVPFTTPFASPFTN